MVTVEYHRNSTVTTQRLAEDKTFEREEAIVVIFGLNEIGIKCGTETNKTVLLTTKRYES